MITKACCWLGMNGTLKLKKTDAATSKMDVPRILSAGVATIDHPQIRFYLLGIQKQDDLPRMTVSFNDNIYSSTDRGQTWRLVKRSASYFDYTASNADTKTLYRHHRNGQHVADLEISRDGGRSWSVIYPKTTKGRHLGSLWIVRTSVRNPGRIFVQGSAVGERGFYISEDFGRTFQLVGAGRYVTESRADSDTLFLLRTDGITISRDRGTNWALLNVDKALFSPPLLGKTGQFRTWRVDSEDREVSCHSQVDITIETDSKDPRLIYLLQDKGFYRSSDAGRSFQLLPLAINMLCDIRSIVVDPLDGRYLFAAVGGSGLFRSSDYGCSWQELALPK